MKIQLWWISHIWIHTTKNYTIYVSLHNLLYLSRCQRHFNAIQGNGLFNLASELGWILWLRIWQFYFHTLRKVMILHASVVALCFTVVSSLSVTDAVNTLLLSRPAAEEPRQSQQNMTARQEFIGVWYSVKNVSWAICVCMGNTGLTLNSRCPISSV